MKNFYKIFTLILMIFSLATSSFAAQNSVILRQKGIDAYNNGNYKLALNYFSQVPKSDHNLEMVICVANSLESLGDVRGAVLLLESLNKRNVNNYSAFYNLGNIYLKSEVYKNAIESYKTCTRLNSKFAPAYYNMGIAYYKSNDLNKALFYFEKAIRLNPSNKDYIYNAGVCLEKMGNVKEANEYFKRAK